MDEIVKATVHRLGTIVGGSIGGYTFAASDLNAIGAGIIAVIGVATDLLVIYLRQRKK